MSLYLYMVVIQSKILKNHHAGCFGVQHASDCATMNTYTANGVRMEYIKSSGPVFPRLPGEARVREGVWRSAGSSHIGVWGGAPEANAFFHRK